MKEILLIIAIISLGSCLEHDGEGLPADQSRWKEARISIQLKNNYDRQYCSLMKYDRFALSHSLLGTFRVTIDTSRDNQISYSFKIEHPEVLLLNLYPIYVQPGTTTEVSFEQFGKDTLHALITKVELLSDKKEAVFLATNLRQEEERKFFSRRRVSQNLLTRLNHADGYLNAAAVIDSLTAEELRTLLKTNSQFNSNTVGIAYIRERLFEKWYINLLIEIIHDLNKPGLSNSTTEVSSDLIRLNQKISTTHDNKQFQYFYSQRKLYEFYYKPRWETLGFQIDTVSNDLKLYDSLTQQYYYTLLLTDKMNQIGQTAYGASVASLVTNPKLKEFILKNRDGSIDNLKVIGKDIVVYDQAGKPFPLSSLVQNSKQPFVYFDFIGSWCVPCLKETEEWTKSDQWVLHSKAVKPYWIFFENNLKDWLNVIKKYNLPEENCFVITDNSLQVVFSKFYDWAGEFPHHFLFSSDGNIINRSAPGMPDFQEKDLPSKVQKEKQGPMPPPLK